MCNVENVQTVDNSPFLFSIKQLKILIVQFNFDSWNINIKFNPFHKSLFKEVKFVKKH